MRKDTSRRGVGGRGTTGRVIQAVRQAGRLAGWGARGADQPEAAGERQRSCRPQKAAPRGAAGGLAGQRKVAHGRRTRPVGPWGRMGYGYTAGWLDI
jgi:hypothetical protein